MLVTLVLVLQQAVVPAAEAAPVRPDIELHATISAKRLRIERDGRAEVTVHAEPLLAETRVIQPSKPVPDRTDVSNVTVKLDAAVTLADPAHPAQPATGEPPQ